MDFSELMTVDDVAGSELSDFQDGEKSSPL